MNTGKTRPAINSGMPKINPTVAPWPRVRLMTRPAIKRTRPMAMLKEKL